MMHNIFGGPLCCLFLGCNSVSVKMFTVLSRLSQHGEIGWVLKSSVTHSIWYVPVRILCRAQCCFLKYFIYGDIYHAFHFLGLSSSISCTSCTCILVSEVTLVRSWEFYLSVYGLLHQWRFNDKRMARLHSCSDHNPLVFTFVLTRFNRNYV